MLRNIFNTFTVKLSSNLLSLIFVVITVNVLGTEGRGEITLFTACTTFIIMLNGLVGSSAIVYLTPRTNFYKLLVPSYIWVIISSIGGTYLIFSLFDFIHNNSFNIGGIHIDGREFQPIDRKHLGSLISLSLIQSLFQINLMVFLGKQKIRLNNYLNLIQIVFILLSIAVLFYLFKQNNFGSFVWSMHIGYGAALLLSFYHLFNLPDTFNLRGMKVAVAKICRLGAIDQFSNILQFFNKRAAYFVLYYFTDHHNVGLLNIGIVATESIWLISQSISMVQYSKLSNSRDEGYNIDLSLNLYKASFILLSCCLVLLLIVPTSLYTFVLGEEYANIKQLFLALGAGTIAMGSGHIFNHYFSGIGKFEQNVYSNSLGLIVTILGCIFLIPLYKELGAALTITMSYGMIGFYLFLAFKFKTKTGLRVFIIRREDLRFYFKKIFPRQA